ncbi:MAG: hypothetical protein QM775_24305 [Pirellulales bacterium]
MVRPLAIICGLLLLAVVALFRAPALGFLGGSFFVALAPTSSIAPIVDLCFEHRAYVSTAPVMALVAIGVYQAWRRISRRCGLSPTVSGAILEVLAWTAVAVLIALTMVAQLRLSVDRRDLGRRRRQSSAQSAGSIQLRRVSPDRRPNG